MAILGKALTKQVSSSHNILSTFCQPLMPVTGIAWSINSTNSFINAK